MPRTSIIEKAMAKHPREDRRVLVPSTDNRLPHPDRQLSDLPGKDLIGERSVVHVKRSVLKKNNIIVANGQRSRTAEEFRLIKRALLAKCASNGIDRKNIILITSALRGEGKTFNSLNLAMSIALEQDYRVLLIDCDVAKATAMKTLGIEAKRGLIDILSNNHLTFADVLIKTDIDGFSVLPSGSRHLLSTELLASSRMVDLIDEVSRRYADRIIIIDAPPVLAASETSVLAQLVGQIVFVVQAERTARETVKEAVNLISQNPNVNLVLNRASGTLSRIRFGTYYENYHNNA